MEEGIMKLLQIAMHASEVHSSARGVNGKLVHVRGAWRWVGSLLKAVACAKVHSDSMQQGINSKGERCWWLHLTKVAWDLSASLNCLKCTSRRPPYQSLYIDI